MTKPETGTLCPCKSGGFTGKARGGLGHGVCCSTCSCFFFGGEVEGGCTAVRTTGHTGSLFCCPLCFLCWFLCFLTAGVLVWFRSTLPHPTGRVKEGGGRQQRLWLSKSCDRFSAHLIPGWQVGCGGNWHPPLPGPVSFSPCTESHSRPPPPGWCPPAAP